MRVLKLEPAVLNKNNKTFAPNTVKDQHYFKKKINVDMETPESTA